MSSLNRALAIVMGEFTIASLALFNTFPTYINLTPFHSITDSVPGEPAEELPAT